MKKLLSLLALLIAMPVAAVAAPTQIAQVPLLNITGTGTVKPNLMLLFDNSGSMDQTYTPDYVNDNLCRSNVSLAAGIMACNVGHPPFMSPDFNKQYYNPAIHYQVPIKSDGTYYPEQTAANTSNWTVVSNDGFGARKADLFGSTGSANINLVSGFPDLKWCTTSSSGVCQFNTSTYSYPDATYKSPIDITTGPYYYTIGVGQYCTDDTMKTCKSTSIGATAPAGYPVPVKVRWCSDKLLTACQGKRVGAFIYPSYSAPAGAIASYGTIAIGASSTATSLNITNIAIAESGGSVNITSGTMSASTGTNTALKQQTMASTVAANIIARSTTNQYYACVKTPTGQPSVPACSVFGITLSAENVVAVVPVTCTGAKNLSNCVTVTDNSRAGWGFTVTANSVRVAPAYVTFSGTTANAGTPAMGATSYNATSLFASMAIGRTQTAAQVAALFIAKIGTSGTYKAYAGNNAACVNALPSNSVCVVDSGSSANTGALTIGAVSNAGTLVSTTAAAAMDTIPTTTAALSAGSGAPNPFVRVNIVSGQTYPKSADRIDCAGATCSYAEEMTNFANWYVYYKSRLQMMKTSVGIAFSPITANYKVGYVKLSNAGAGSAIDLKPADFTGSARSTWYTTLYNTTTSGSTPIRTAMDNVGRMFANLTPYNYAAGQEVVQYPCQPNFMILTTDGYWNGSSTANVVNNDNTESAARFCSISSGCVDARAQTQPSIADVALHWYNGGSSTSTVSLRPALEPDMTKPGSVPAANGENTHLHMNTYTLGLGVDGVMTYEANYDTAPKPGGDFYNLITQAPTGCPWNGGGAYVWPDPDTTNTASTVQERVDDLWHAAINGHGKYFSAQDPKDVVAGLREALSNMQVRTGAAAAAATSTPNITLTDNDIFSATFTTVRWYGELTDRKIDTTTGDVIKTPTWSTSTTVGKAIATRKIKMMQANQSPNTDPVDFTFTNMDTATQGWFANKCSILAQCTLLSASDKAIVNSGTNMVNWLRGVQDYADDNLFRAYSTATDAAGATVPIVIGDIASSKPAYLREPHNNYPDSAYTDYKNAKASRPGTVFVAANDGMLHAFDGATGNERWAYVPRIVMSKLAALASTTYGTNHQFTADGSPEVADVKINGAWTTMLVGGLNAGGRGYYALDVSNPDAPKVMWEICADAAVCPQNRVPELGELGLSFGNPQFGIWQDKWVVFLTSGYNNIPGTDGVATGSGVGMLFIIDAATGRVLKTASTGSGNTTTPSGLAKITAISSDPLADAKVTYIYGGDNQGQMWRFDLTATTDAVSVVKMGDAGTTKPITTRPDVTLCGVPTTTTDASGLSTTKTVATRVVLFGTGRLLDVPDTTNTDVQTLFALKDSGTALGTIPTSSLVQQTLSVSGSTSNSVTYAVTNNPVDLSVKNGWYFNWNLNAGERMNLDPQIVSGVVNVVTNVPSSSSACSVGGTSNLYQVDVCTGQGVNGDPAGATLSNTSAAVGFIIVRLPSGQLKLITTFADGSNATSRTKELDTAEAHRVGWRRIKGE
ncbi:type IV pilus assembly protein PilY1 [Duganella sp. CF402]|uniref:PilC/PilY family type IV pilus protein n=1 Tax=unclassified Duganella TaxID=2636909 RepID=UPI0008BBB290|nr:MULTISPECIES: PilC/PilY family type IV pilus protein [unclassified Duganella]RZT10079.1 type IV pilus assembly protein PilY1 [Duganella sp. BK701]SEL29397.1 type IV pilus assembly protein PilY1 [Duganella sp. CF402]